MRGVSEQMGRADLWDDWGQLARAVPGGAIPIQYGTADAPYSKWDLVHTVQAHGPPHISLRTV